MKHLFRLLNNNDTLFTMIYGSFLYYPYALLLMAFRLFGNSQVTTEELRDKVISFPNGVLMGPSLEDHKGMAPYYQSFLENRNYEDNITRIVSSSLHTGDTFVDVGAHVGYFAILASKLVGNGQVISIEPTPTILSALKNNVEINQCSNVIIYECAVGENEGKAYLYLSNSSTQLNSLAHVPWAFKRIEIDVKTLDSILKHPPDLVKIDAEGYEYEILLGGRKSILEHGAYLILEYNKGILAKRGSSYQKIFDLLIQYGYHIKEILPDGSMSGDIFNYRSLESPFTNLWATVTK